MAIFGDVAALRAALVNTWTYGRAVLATVRGRR